MKDSSLARRAWRVEESAFVAGAPWRAIGGAGAIVHPEVPEVWDAAFIARVPIDADPKQLLNEGRRHMASQGCGHLKILIDDPHVFSTVGLSLGRRGLFRRIFSTLCTHSVPPKQASKGAVHVEPVRTPGDRAVLAQVRDAVRRQAPWYTKDVSRALDAWEDVQQAALDLTWLVAFLDEVPAGAAGLLMTEDGASLQSLATVPSLRRQGVASGLVREVVRRGLDGGAPFVSLLTDTYDSPRRLYKRLGFRDAGHVHEFLQALY